MMGCQIVGDSIALGVSEYIPMCYVRATVGIPSATIVGRIGDAHVVVVSAGSNDPANPHLEENLRAIRSKARHVVWIAPANPRAAALVRKVAAEHGDKVVSFTAGPDGVHPRSYETLARAIIPPLVEAEAMTQTAPGATPR